MYTGAYEGLTRFGFDCGSMTDWTKPINDGKWHNYVITAYYTNLQKVLVKTYIDGQLQTVNSQDWSRANPETAPEYDPDLKVDTVTVGSGIKGKPFYGNLADFKIYEGVLKEGEIGDLYRQGRNRALRGRIVAWYTFMPTEMGVADIRYDDLTHLVFNYHQTVNFFFDAEGHIHPKKVFEKDLNEMVRRAHAKGVKVLIGWPGTEDETTWRTMMSNAKARGRYISELFKYVLDHNLDGVEYDWEGYNDREGYSWLGAEGQADRTYFTSLVIETKKAFAGHNLLVSFCGGISPGLYFINPEAIPYVDWVNLMTYTGNAFSSTEYIADKLKLWADFGMPKAKIHLGIPFYGKSDDGSQFLTYGDIRKKCPDLNPQDNKCGEILFHGERLIRDKIDYVIKNNYGGIFCFYINLDSVNEDKSLLGIIGDAMRN